MLCSVRERIKGRAAVGWMLPTPYMQPTKPCHNVTTSNGTACLAGFTLQGMIDVGRRNYSSVWEGIKDGYKTSSVRVWEGIKDGHETTINRTQKDCVHHRDQ